MEVTDDGAVASPPTITIVEDAAEAWRWLSRHGGAVALGIDTLLAWSPSGSRECDNALRRRYRLHGPTVIPQNALRSSMTINGAMVARWAATAGLPMFESHPKLLIKVASSREIAAESILNTYGSIKEAGAGSAKLTKQVDDMADAAVAAWCAAQGFLGRWSVDLFRTPGDALERVADGVSYPWFEGVQAR